MKKKIRFKSHKTDVIYIYNNFRILDKKYEWISIGIQFAVQGDNKLSFKIRKLDKGKPLERVGRKATGLNPVKQGIL